jgi:hypothetical protein
MNECATPMEKVKNILGEMVEDVEKYWKQNAA